MRQQQVRSWVVRLDGTRGSSTIGHLHPRPACRHAAARARCGPGGSRSIPCVAAAGRCCRVAAACRPAAAVGGRWLRRWQLRAAGRGHCAMDGAGDEGSGRHAGDAAAAGRGPG